MPGPPRLETKGYGQVEKAITVGDVVPGPNSPRREKEIVRTGWVAPS